jgi:hypothetical protein
VQAALLQDVWWNSNSAFGISNQLFP